MCRTDADCHDAAVRAVQPFVLEKARVAGDQHGQVVDRVHDGDLGSGRSFLRGHSGLISTLRNFTTPAPYCSAIGPRESLLSRTSTVRVPLSVTMRCGPIAVIS